MTWGEYMNSALAFLNIESNGAKYKRKKISLSYLFNCDIQFIYETMDIQKCLSFGYLQPTDSETEDFYLLLLCASFYYFVVP